ncbi:hypothetical protein [Limnobacter parvus]|uniref:Uncharacterized protein n=1 Tax=Limnobacter parvus TaxID=2939690 RepID=A0ABT1XKH2_9BURK|nr:hypothetical protein [Limnobacter parvus]MCR2747361.1 hypothetical protein [Limnobacter parvus]
MNIALVVPHRDDKLLSLDCQSIETDIALELDHVAYGLKSFADQLRKTRSAQARFAKVIQLKIWVLNKPTVLTLLEQYLEQVTLAQQWLHLDMQSHDNAIESLCEQLLFLSTVFEQESELMEQIAVVDPNLALCD